MAHTPSLPGAVIFRPFGQEARAAVAQHPERIRMSQHSRWRKAAGLCSGRAQDLHSQMGIVVGCLGQRAKIWCSK